VHAAIAPEVPPALVTAEVVALAADELLVDNGRLRVYCTVAARIRWTLQELGRLREITFRAAGEGTGKPSDIDLYDAYYRHLFVWDARDARIVGGYRLGLTDEIIARYGTRGLYRRRSSATAGRSCRRSIPRSSWAARSCASNASATSPRCCCCGAASANSSLARRNTRCCSAPSASATATPRRRVR
jgi:hypothetical protein